MDPSEPTSPGCVYIFSTSNPLVSNARIAAVDATEWPDHDLAVSRGIRASRLLDGLDHTLIDSFEPRTERDWRSGVPPRHQQVTWA